MTSTMRNANGLLQEAQLRCFLDDMHVQGWDGVLGHYLLGDVELLERSLLSQASLALEMVIISGHSY